MKYTLTKATYDDIDNILELLNSCFNIDFKQSVAKIYQHLDEYFNEHYIVKDENKIIATLLIHTQYLNIMHQKLKIAMIGSVCVHPDYRNLGIMQMMINHANKIVEDNDYDLSVLCGKYDRYHHFGYEKLHGAYMIHYDYDKKLIIPSYNFILIDYLNDNEINKLNSINKDIYFDRKYLKDALNQWHNSCYAIYYHHDIIGYLVYDQKVIKELYLMYNYNVDTIIHSFMDSFNLKNIDLIILAMDRKLLANMNNYYQLDNNEQLARIINYPKVLSVILNYEKNYRNFNIGTYDIYIENYGGMEIIINNDIVVKNVDLEKYDYNLDEFKALEVFLNSKYGLYLYFYDSDLI